MSKYKLKNHLLKEEVNPERNELILYHLTGLDKFRKYSEDVVNFMKNYEKNKKLVHSRRQHVDAGAEDSFNYKLVSKYAKLTGDRKKDILQKIKLFNTLDQYDVQGKELDDKLMLMGLEALLADPYTKGTGFSAGSGDSYGPALYTCYDFNPKIAYIYGTTCLKFTTSFDGILIFLEDLAKEVYGENWKLEDQIVVIFEHMFGSNLDEYLIQLKAKLIEFLKPYTSEIIGKNMFDHTRHSHIKYAGISAGPAKDFADFLKRDVSDELRTDSFLGAPKGAQIYQYIMKGMMFNGGTDGPVCLLYNPKKDVQITQIGKVNNEDVNFFDSMSDYFEGRAGIDIPFEQLNAIGEDLEEPKEDRHQSNYQNLMSKKEEYPTEFKFMSKDLLYTNRDIKDSLSSVIQKVDAAIKEDSNIDYEDIKILVETLLNNSDSIELFSVEILEMLFLHFTRDIVPKLDFAHYSQEAKIQINNIVDCLVKISNESSDFISKIPEVFENLFFKRAQVYKKLSFYYVYEFVKRANQSQISSEISKNIILTLSESNAENVCAIFKDLYGHEDEDHDKFFEIIRFINDRSDACQKLFEEYISALEVILNKDVTKMLKEKDFLSDTSISRALSEEQIVYYENMIGLNFSYESLVSSKTFNEFFDLYKNAVNTGIIENSHYEKIALSIYSDSLAFSISSLSSKEVESLIRICNRSVMYFIALSGDTRKIKNRIMQLLSFVNMMYKTGPLDSSSLAMYRSVIEVNQMVGAEASPRDPNDDWHNIFIDTLLYLIKIGHTGVKNKVVGKAPFMLNTILTRGEKDIFEKIILVFDKNDYLKYFQSCTDMYKHIKFIRYILDNHQDKINDRTKALFDSIIEHDNVMNKLNSSNESLYLLKNLIKESLKLYNE